MTLGDSPAFNIENEHIFCKQKKKATNHQKTINPWCSNTPENTIIPAIFYSISAHKSPERIPAIIYSPYSIFLLLDIIIKLITLSTIMNSKNMLNVGDNSTQLFIQVLLSVTPEMGRDRVRMQEKISRASSPLGEE